MANVNVVISDELFNLARKRNIPLNETLERSLWEEILWEETMENIARTSKLTERDVAEIGKKIKAGIAKRHGL